MVTGQFVRAEVRCIHAEDGVTRQLTGVVTMDQGVERIMKTSFVQRILLACLGLMVLAGGSYDASAIPPFARTYKVPCSTCHTAVTRRSEFGDVFRKAGYRWPGAPGTDAKVQRPSPIEMKGISAHLALLPAQLPLGFVAQMPVTWTNEEKMSDTVELNKPSLALLFGSTLGEHFAFFGTWAGSGSPNELNLHVARIFSRPELNLRLGQMEPTTTLFKNNERLIQPFNVTASSPTGHSIGGSRRGIELNGILLDRTFYAVGAVKNGGVGSSFDYYYHLSQKIGGMDLHGEEPDINLDDPTFWEDIVLTIGHYGYFGSISNIDREEEAQIMRFGLDAKLRIYDFTLWSGAMVGLDKDVLVGAKNESLTWFSEVTYAFTSWLVGSYMYSYQDAADMADYGQRHDAGLILLPLENIRIRLKYGYSADDTKNDVAEAHLFFGF